MPSKRKAVEPAPPLCWDTQPGRGDANHERHGLYGFSVHVETSGRKNAPQHAPDSTHAPGRVKKKVRKYRLTLYGEGPKMRV